MDLASVAAYYNKSKVRSFQGKTALKRYLDPVGLFNHPPTRDYGNNTSTIDSKNESRYFEALHFVKYRLACALKDDKHVQFWADMHLAVRNRIVSANMGLVFVSIKITSYFFSPDHEDNMETLRSIGTITLIRATEKFDPWRGYRFCTYAIRSMLHEYSNKVKKYNRPPMLDITECDAPDSEEDKQQAFLIDRVMSALHNSNITKREREILDRRYFKQLILHDVAEEFGLSKERIRQIQLVAVEKLRETLTSDPLFKGP